VILKIGIDLGGSKIEGVVLDDQHRVLARKRIATEPDQGPQHIVQRIASLARSLERDTKALGAPVGVGTPGSLSPRTGLLRNSNTVCLNGYPLKEALEDELQQRITLENDANCFALAEARLGAGRGYHCVFGVIIGTGCGGGIVLDGQIRTGAQGLAGEWGHMVIDPAGAPCYCGAHGCVETFISGSGLQRYHNNRTGQSISAQAIFAGDDDAHRKSQLHYLNHFGQALANLMTLIDPDIIVLGGGLSHIDRLYTDGVTAVAQRLFGREMSTRIVRHALGDSAGVIGAALLAR
jgi:predicted NBD/HSP70 family sugar kinase